MLTEQSEDGKPLIFTAFDANGRGRELARFATKPGEQYSWGLSPDGTRVALIRDQGSRIHILPLDGGPLQTVQVKGWDHLVLIYWSADGQSWLTCGFTPSSTVLLRVDKQGNAVAIWEQKEVRVIYGLPSPDGRHLAIVSTLSKRNVWLMEGF